MIDIAKKTLLAGLGAAIVTKDAIESTLHEWIEKGKITPDEARHFAEKLIRTGEGQWEKTSDALSQVASDLVQKAPVAKRSELTALEARVAVLEQIVLRAHQNAIAGAAQPSTESEI